MEHEENHPGNWSSADRVRIQATQDSRNIWTAMPGASYIGNWNNFTNTDETRNEISSLFNQLDFTLVDFTMVQLVSAVQILVRQVLPMS